MKATFTIPGPPVGKQRARTVRTSSGKARSYTPTKTKAWETKCAVLARRHWRTPSCALVRLTVEAVKARPQRLMRKADPDGRIRCGTTPDLDNITKAVGDALNGICYGDDSQVVELVASKWYAARGEGPCVEVTVGEIE